MMRTYYFYGCMPVDTGWEHLVPVDQFFECKPDADDGTPIIDNFSLFLDYLKIRKAVKTMAGDILKELPHVFFIPTYTDVLAGFLFKFENGGNSWIISPVELYLENAQCSFSWKLSEKFPFPDGMEGMFRPVRGTEFSLSKLT